jgi:hypothetical protein
VIFNYLLTLLLILTKYSEPLKNSKYQFHPLTKLLKKLIKKEEI